MASSGETRILCFKGSSRYLYRLGHTDHGLDSMYFPKNLLSCASESVHLPLMTILARMAGLKSTVAIKVLAVITLSKNLVCQVSKLKPTGWGLHRDFRNAPIADLANAALDASRARYKFQPCF